MLNKQALSVIMLESRQSFGKSRPVRFKDFAVENKIVNSISGPIFLEVFSISSKFRGVLLISVSRFLADRMIPDDNC